MFRLRWPRFSLATKCRILFGVSVLIILSATLYLPWVHMQSLAQAADLRVAERVATTARLLGNLDVQDWVTARKQLALFWPDAAKRYRLPSHLPELYSSDDERFLRTTSPHGFLVEAFNTFLTDPDRRTVHKFEQEDDGHWLRMALAIRGLDTDADPHRLRGIIHVRVPVQEQSYYWSIIVLVLAVLSGGFLAMLMFYLVTQRLILSPVRALRSVAQQVTGGDMNVRATITTGDEFQQLSQAFNEMLERIERSHEELRKINRSLDVKLEELAQTNVALYESNKLKSEFIGNVSHELRTPMGLIINFAELLRDALEAPPEDKSRMLRYAENILKSARSLLEIINDLLDLAKIEAGKVELHLGEVSVIQICEALTDFVRPLADKKEITLESPTDGSLPTIQSDAGKVKQILYNLLSNAIKFTPQGGRVRLDAGPNDNTTVWMCVADTGPGIPEDKLDVIFEKFRQIDSSLTREHGGTGLGLAITKELVGVLGGSIKVESKEGEGSTFTVTLPIEAPAPSQRRLISLNS